MTTPTPDQDRLLTPGEVADIFRVDQRTVSQWANRGQISYILTPGGYRRFPESEIQRLLDGEADQ